MSNEDKSRAAAAQLLIDDEPDDWCVQNSSFSVWVDAEIRGTPVESREKYAQEASKLTKVSQGQAHLQHRLRRRKRKIDRLLLREERLAGV